MNDDRKTLHCSHEYSQYFLHQYNPTTTNRHGEYDALVAGECCDVAVEREVVSASPCLACRHRHAENGVRAKLGLVV